VVPRKCRRVQFFMDEACFKDPPFFITTIVCWGRVSKLINGIAIPFALGGPSYLDSITCRGALYVKGDLKEAG
jgi:hypothetical protein